MIDGNCDGVLSFEEWTEILTTKVEAQTNIYNVMGDVNITDPLELEERILDLQYRSRHLEGELKFLRQQNGPNPDAKKKAK